MRAAPLPSEADCNEFIDLLSALIREDPANAAAALPALACASRAKIALLNGAPAAAAKMLGFCEQALLQGAPPAPARGALFTFGRGAA